jgi:branched-chain amino acid transport system substrate-binding protein
VSISVGSVIKPAGEQAALGMITSGYLKDSTDPAWKNDAGMDVWRAFMAKEMPGADLTDNNYTYGYLAARVMHHVLVQCKGDFSRPHVLKQAASISPPLEIPVLLPGITVSTSSTNYHPIRAMQLQRWDGTKWVRFGEILEGTT